MLKGKRKALSVSVMLAILGLGYSNLAAAAEPETRSFELEKIIVEGERALPGEMVNANGSVGILGNKDVMDTPFSVTNVSQKTLDLFLGPNEPLDKALVGVPSVRAAGSV